MKTGYLHILLLIVFLYCFSCEKSEKENYPKEVSFTEYSLPDSMGEWANLAYDGKVIVINSSEELEKHIISYNGTYPEIDFSEKTLLLVSIADRIIDMDTAFSQISSDHITVNFDLTHVLETRHIPLLVAKLPDKAAISLNQTIHDITAYKQTVAYVVGYNSLADYYEDGRYKIGEYLLISEDLTDTLAVYNLPDNLFAFPEESMSYSYDGFVLFQPSSEYRYAYKVQMTYRQMRQDEYYRRCIWTELLNPDYIFITSINKIQ
jgi:hypothetical protein